MNKRRTKNGQLHKILFSYTRNQEMQIKAMTFFQLTGLQKLTVSKNKNSVA